MNFERFTLPWRAGMRTIVLRIHDVLEFGPSEHRSKDALWPKLPEFTAPTPGSLLVRPRVSTWALNADDVDKKGTARLCDNES